MGSAMAGHLCNAGYKVQAWDIDRAIIDIIREIESLSPPAIHPTIIRHPITEERILYVT